MDKETNPPKYLMWEPSQATLDRDMSLTVSHASVGCHLFGVQRTQEVKCKSIVVERVPPQGAPREGAQRYQAVQSNW